MTNEKHVAFHRSSSVAFIVRHSALVICFNRSTTFSVCTPREPLTRTRSPSRTNPASASAASSEVSKKAVAPSLMPASRAPPRTPHSTSTPSPAMSRPASRWSAADSAPSSNISPATTTRRFTSSPPCATASAIASSERGFELYESSTTVKPAAKLKTSPRICDGAAVESASAIAAGARSNEVATAAAARALDVCRAHVRRVVDAVGDDPPAVPRAHRDDERVVRVQHRRAPRLQAFDDLRLAFGNRLDRTHEFEVHGRHREYHGHVGRRHRAMPRDLAGQRHPHLEDGHVEVLRPRPPRLHLQDGERDAQLVVEVLAAPQDPPAARAEHVRRQVLRRRLARAARDADDGAAPLPEDAPRQHLQRLDHVLDEEQRPAHRLKLSVALDPRAARDRRRRPAPECA